jgi:hypothetical protein
MIATLARLPLLIISRRSPVAAEATPQSKFRRRAPTSIREESSTQGKGQVHASMTFKENAMTTALIVAIVFAIPESRSPCRHTNRTLTSYPL